MFYKFTYDTNGDVVYGSMYYSPHREGWAFMGKLHFPIGLWDDLKKRWKAGGIIIEQGIPSEWELGDFVKPACSLDDPATAIAAAHSKEAKKSLERNGARCVCTMHELNEAKKFLVPGLCNFQMIDEYIVKFPEQVDHRGPEHLSPLIQRAFDRLKINKPRIATNMENMGLIHATEAIRKNPITGKPCTVFDFVHPLTVDQLRTMYDRAEQPGRTRKFRREI